MGVLAATQVDAHQIAQGSAKTWYCPEFETLYGEDGHSRSLTGYMRGGTGAQCQGWVFVMGIKSGHSTDSKASNTRRVA